MDNKMTRTFPDGCPEDISILSIEHDPLVTDGVFIHGTLKGVGLICLSREGGAHGPRETIFLTCTRVCRY